MRRKAHASGVTARTVMKLSDTMLSNAANDGSQRHRLEERLHRASQQTFVSVALGSVMSPNAAQPRASFANGASTSVGEHRDVAPPPPPDVMDVDKVTGGLRTTTPPPVSRSWWLS